MILAIERESAIECTICGKKDGVSPKAIADGNLLNRLMKRMESEHRSCEQYADRPSRAKAERTFRERMQAELRNASLA